MSTMTIMTLGALPAHRTVQQTTTQLLRPKDSLPAHLQPTAGTCVIVSNNGAYLAPNVAVGTPASPPHLTNLVTTAAPTILTSSALNNNIAKMKNNNAPTSDSKNGPGARASNKSRPIAPAGAGAGGGRAAEVNDSRCKRRIHFNPTNASLQVAPHQTASVARRNARERNRVKQVNNGFATLRSHIPASVAAALMEQSPPPQERGARSAKDKDAAKKLSKVETLRMAVEYIRSLQELLAEHGVATSENTAPVVQVKTESVASGSPTGFDPDYDSALPHFNHQLHPHSGLHSLLPGGSLSSPACSDASTSPTPSYVSDGSVGGTSVGGYTAPTSMFGRAPTIPQHHQSSLLSSGTPATSRVPPESPPVHHHVSSTGSPTSTMFHDSYEQTFNPEDEELLDEIYWWQESQ